MERLEIYYSKDKLTIKIIFLLTILIFGFFQLCKMILDFYFTIGVLFYLFCLYSVFITLKNLIQNKLQIAIDEKNIYTNKHGKIPWVNISSYKIWLGKRANLTLYCSDSIVRTIEIHNLEFNEDYLIYILDKFHKIQKTRQ